MKRIQSWLEKRKNFFPRSEVRSIIAPVRNPMVISAVRKRANYCCERCGWQGFEIENGDKYVEVHHLKMLAEGGADIPENAVALCPNCHREFHYGVNSRELLESLYERVSRLIRE